MGCPLSPPRCMPPMPPTPICKTRNRLFLLTWARVRKLGAVMPTVTMAPVLRKVRRVTGCLVGELFFMNWCIGERRGEASSRTFDSRGPGRNPWADCSVANRKRQISSPTARVAQRRGTTLRASPVPVRIRPRAPFRPASIKVMQRTFNPLNGERYPGGPPAFTEATAR